MDIERYLQAKLGSRIGYLRRALIKRHMSSKGSGSPIGVAAGTHSKGVGLLRGVFVSLGVGFLLPGKVLSMSKCTREDCAAFPLKGLYCKLLFTTRGSKSTSIDP